MDKPFQLKVTNVNEVRMGSPYNSCTIELCGFDKLKLSKFEIWQDKYCWTADADKLVLIKFDFEANVPGFRFFIIDTTTGGTKESARVFGLVNDIRIIENIIIINKFLHNKELSVPGKLCCELEEAFDIL